MAIRKPAANLVRYCRNGSVCVNASGNIAGVRNRLRLAGHVALKRRTPLHFGSGVRGCGGPIRTDYTIFDDTVPQRIGAFRRVVLELKRMLARFRLAENRGQHRTCSHLHCLEAVTGGPSKNPGILVPHPAIHVRAPDSIRFCADGISFV